MGSSTAQKRIADEQSIVSSEFYRTFGACSKGWDGRREQGKSVEGGRTEEASCRQRNTDRIGMEMGSPAFGGEAETGGARAGRGIGWRLVWHGESW